MFVVVSVDVMDISGEQQFDVEHTVFKRRVDQFGRPVSLNDERENSTMRSLPFTLHIDAFSLRN